MPNKEAILDNVEQYSASQLLEFIHSGIVTFDELCTETGGFFPANVRKELEALLAGSEEDDWQNAKESNSKELLGKYLMTYPNGNHRDEARQLISRLQTIEAQGHVNDEWNDVDKDDIDALREFVNEHPDSPHCTEARRRINELYVEISAGSGKEQLLAEIERINNDLLVNNQEATITATIKSFIVRNKISRSDFLSIIEDDNNVFKPVILNSLINESYIGYNDFAEIGIDSRFIRQLIKGEEPPRFGIASPLEKISKQSTEVYFWGIPSSGKSCALGSILSVAANGHVAKSMRQNTECQGYGYMFRLSSLFNTSDHMAVLPERNEVTATYEMGFDLEDMKGNVHPITCVDLAGELFRCMYKMDAGENLSPDESDTLKTLTSVLVDNRTGNRKMHFFVLEYGAENKKFDGLSQDVYLNAGLRYIESTGILKNETDAIFLMITKADKIKTDDGQRKQEVLRNYIDNNYRGFYNGLQKICRDNEINNGNVEIIPFSLGKVCFQDYCLFDEAPAANVVRKILERSKGSKSGKISRLFKILGK